MSADQLERREAQVNKKMVEKRGSIMTEMGRKLKSMVMILLDPSLKKEKVEGEMRNFLPVIEEWLMGGGSITQRYNPGTAEIESKEWTSFLRCKKGISFFLERVGGGTKRLCIQRVRKDNGRGVMMWLADPGVRDGFGGIDRGFEDECEEIFMRDGDVMVDRDVQTRHLSFRLQQIEAE